MRGATNATAVTFSSTEISIHAPLAGCDMMAAVFNMLCLIFQSTHPLRGATKHATQRNKTNKDFNPRTPCGVRLWLYLRRWLRSLISIHAPLAGCDQLRLTTRLGTKNFNPRTPCGVRLCDDPDGVFGYQISIHAPLAGCDCFFVAYL